ncbi:MAG TPA: ferredoxin family protein [Ignavibacteriaceae bacterium]|nr:ferredoxin family protein [Ignavibacteriaceae bacterium]
MAKDLSNQLWHGIPRKEIPWYPTITAEKCIGCELCYISCGREVFEYDESTRKAVVERNYNCMVGCSTCSTVCPTEAITFPGRDLIWKFEKEYKIFKEVRKEGKEKREKKKVQEDRVRLESQISKISSRVKFELAGQFGAKELPKHLKSLIANRPYDVVNFQMQVPTMKGADEGAPCYSSFEVTSTEQADISTFADEVRNFIKEKGVVLVSETKL